MNQEGAKQREEEEELGEESTGRNSFKCPNSASGLAAVQGRSHTHTHTHWTLRCVVRIPVIPSPLSLAPQLSVFIRPEHVEARWPEFC